MLYKIKHSCGNIFKDDLYRLPRCKKCFGSRSYMEDYFSNVIISLGFDPITNSRVIKSKSSSRNLELDIYLKQLKIGFEYNGVYYHSNIDRDYHQFKTSSALNDGIKIYHIWEYDNLKIIESKISVILGVLNKKYEARELMFLAISKEDWWGLTQFDTEEEARELMKNHSLNVFPYEIIDMGE